VSSAGFAVRQPDDNRDADHLTQEGQTPSLFPAGQPVGWGWFAKALMRPRLVVESNELMQDTVEMLLIEDEHVIQIFST